MLIRRSGRGCFAVWAVALLALPVGPATALAQVAETDSVLRSEIPEFVEQTLSLYRSDPDSSRVSKILAAWDVPKDSMTGDQLLAVAALWRRAGQHRLAFDALAAIPDSYAHRGAADLEEARILFSAGLDDEAVVAFWAACERLDAGAKSQLWLDIRGLATPEEQEQWSELPPGPESCGWIRDFFGERAWRMAMSADERVALHYARLEEARRDYRIRRARGPVDMSDQIGRAPGLEFDDRGLVYLRMGPPHRRAGFIGIGAQPNESWAYYGRRDRDYIYHFSPVSRMTRPMYGGPLPVERGENATTTGELVVGPDVTLALGAVTDAPLKDYRILERLAWVGGDPILLYQSREGLGGNAGYYATWYLRAHQAREVERVAAEAGEDIAVSSRPPHLALSYPPQFSDLQKMALEERLENWEAAEFVIETVPDVPEVVREIEFAHETLRFLDPHDATARVWALVAFRCGDLKPGSEEGVFRYDVTTSFAAQTRAGVVAGRVAGRLESPRELSDESGLDLFTHIDLPAGRHAYTVSVRDEATREPTRGNWVQDTLSVPATAPTLPAVSDIAVASDSGGSWTRDGRTFLRVSPTHLTSPAGDVHVYFEVYGIAPGGEYDVDVRVVTEKDAKKAHEMSARKAAFALRFTDAMPAAGPPIGRHYLRIELGDARSGSYVISVRARDPSRDVTSLPGLTSVRRP